jgi:fatty-acyl-CoA synthase
VQLLVGDVFRNAARAVPDRLAAVEGESTLTFAELDRQGNRMARAIADTGTARGDRVVVWCDTHLEVAPLFVALAKLGAAFAPANSTLSAEEAAPIVESAEPSLLVVDRAHADAGALIADKVGCALAVLEDLAAADASDADYVVPELSEDDTHVIFFTSGSTGRPKGVVLSHRVNFLRTHPGVLPEPRGVAVSPYPLFHMGAWTIALQQWQARDAVVFTPTDAASICDAIERYRATRINAIPAIWRRVLEHVASPEGSGRDLSSIRFADTGTSATPLELLQAIEAVVPQATLRVFYGSTEGGPVAALEHADVHRKPGSVGTPAPFAEVRLSPEGEICVRGPHLFQGYYGNPEATAEVLVDGWYHMGDLAELDDEGYLRIAGRARDIIRTGGETVAPGEVEAVLADHPAVGDLAVVGMPDPQWGEVICAALVLAPGATEPTVEELRAHCEGRLARFKHPRRVAVVDEIPRTVTTGQVRRSYLVEQLSR